MWTISLMDLFYAAEKSPVPDQVINIGNNREIAICDLVHKIHELSESKSELRIGALENRPTEIWRMCAIIQELKKFWAGAPRSALRKECRKPSNGLGNI